MLLALRKGGPAGLCKPSGRRAVFYLCRASTVAGSHFSNTPTRMKTAEIHTPKGVMKVEFYEQDAPNTVKNFLDLASKGFYDGTKFHRVIPNFMIQGGDPNTKPGAKGQPGTGGPGYKIKCETSGNNQYHDRGVLSMAHAGKDTGGSQFFIVHGRQNTAHLDRVHTVFGKVVEGDEVIDQIRGNDEITKIVVKDEE
jgi:peptidyl-prolyl cis-trans isomerase B (cyclophilin B)